MTWSLLGQETLDGVPVYHLQAVKTFTAKEYGEILPAELWADLGIEIEDIAQLEIDYFIDSANGRFLKNTVNGEFILSLEGNSGSRRLDGNGSCLGCFGLFFGL